MPVTAGFGSAIAVQAASPVAPASASTSGAAVAVSASFEVLEALANLRRTDAVDTAVLEF